jgi:hypothetical protein
MPARLLRQAFCLVSRRRTGTRSCDIPRFISLSGQIDLKGAKLHSGDLNASPQFERQVIATPGKALLCVLRNINCGDYDLLGAGQFDNNDGLLGFMRAGYRSFIQLWLQVDSR